MSTAKTGVLVCAVVVTMAIAVGQPPREASAAQPDVVRGGAVPLPRDQITPTERARIETVIATNLQRLRDAGLLPPIAPKAGIVTPLQWPLQLVPGHPEQSARTIANYVDHEPGFPGQVLDYNCGTRSYDTADGYNHQGTDITAFPFGWRKMDNDEAIVVAAVPGIVIAKEDGQFDRSCTLNNNTWNAVYLRHLDGSIAWYGHLKSGSLTTKKFGEWVLAGEFLGVMGSSGDSTGPHLHFELYDSSSNLVDPFAGACNNFNSQSWWGAQRAYNEPAIDLVMTGDAPVDFSPCPTPEVEHRNSFFQPGQTVYLTAFFTDQLRADASVFNVYAPDGTLFTTTTIPSDADYYAASFWQNAIVLPMSAAAGTWRFEVVFHSQTQSVNFEVGATEPPRVDIVEYYAASLNHYFMTGFATEEAALDAQTPIAGWQRTGLSFPAYSTADPTLATVCRFFGTPGLGVNSHFYTGFDFECAAVKQEPGWTFEADAFYIAANVALCPASTRPVFRLYNNGMGGDPNHRYTTSWPVINAMQLAGWVLEGVAFCAPL